MTGKASETPRGGLESLFSSRAAAIQKAFAQERSVYEVVAAHLALESLCGALDRVLAWDESELRDPIYLSENIIPSIRALLVKE